MSKSGAARWRRPGGESFDPALAQMAMAHLKSGYGASAEFDFYAAVIQMAAHRVRFSVVNKGSEIVPR